MASLPLTRSMPRGCEALGLTVAPFASRRARSPASEGLWSTVSRTVSPASVTKMARESPKLEMNRLPLISTATKAVEPAL